MPSDRVAGLASASIAGIARNHPSDDRSTWERWNAAWYHIVLPISSAQWLVSPTSSDSNLSMLLIASSQDAFLFLVLVESGSAAPDHTLPFSASPGVQHRRRSWPTGPSGGPTFWGCAFAPKRVDLLVRETKKVRTD